MEQVPMTTNLMNLDFSREYSSSIGQPYRSYCVTILFVQDANYTHASRPLTHHQGGIESKDDELERTLRTEQSRLFLAADADMSLVGYHGTGVWISGFEYSIRHSSLVNKFSPIGRQLLTTSRHA